MLRHTETVPKNVLSGSETPQLQSKPSCKLLFPSKSSPGHQRIEVHRNCHQKPAQKVKKASRYMQNRATDYDLGRNRLQGISLARYTEIVPKNVLDGSKNPHVQPNRATNYDLRLNRLLGINVSRHTETVPKNVLGG